jgi:hypothetical protein
MKNSGTRFSRFAESAVQRTRAQYYASRQHGE